MTGSGRQLTGGLLRSEQGLAFLALTYFLATWFLLLGTTMLTRSVSERLASLRSRDQHVAFVLAEAGVDRALKQLAADANYAGELLPLPTGTVNIAVQLLSGNLYQITASGRATGQSLSEEHDVRATIQLIQQQGSIFQFGVFGAQGVIVLNDIANPFPKSTFDSFDSRIGAYSALTARSNATIATNATANPGGSTWAIELRGDVTPIELKGQVVVGPNVQNPDSLVRRSGSVTITGSPQVVSQTQALSLPPINIPPGLDCSAPLTVDSGRTKQLTGGGTYCYSEITVYSRGKLTATASNQPTVIYVTGRMQALDRTIVGIVDKPTKMVFLSTHVYDPNAWPLDTKYVRILGGDSNTMAKFYGAIYAPNNLIQISFADFQGAAVGSIAGTFAVQPSKANVHYDEALKDLTIPGLPAPSGSSTPKLLSWQDAD